MRSIMRLLKPHSLSYQLKILRVFVPIALVLAASTIELRGSPMKSQLTSSSSSKPKTPLSAPCEAALSAAFAALCGDWLTRGEHDVYERDVRGWDANCHPVELTREVREHEPDRRSCAGR